MVGEGRPMGAVVMHGGRQYIVRGYTRMSLGREQYVDLEDAETGERFSLPADEVLPAPAPPPDEPARVIPLRPDL